MKITSGGKWRHAEPQNVNIRLRRQPTRPYNSGLAIEGLAILASISRGNETTQRLLSDIITAAILESVWQSNDGIIINTVELATGLSAAYIRNVTSPELREDLKAFLGVQFNALVDLATTRHQHLRRHLAGLPQRRLLCCRSDRGAWSALGWDAGRGWARAVGVHLWRGFLTYRERPAAGTPRHPKKSAVGPIVGGVAGGLALLAAALVVLFAIRRRRRHQSDLASPPPPAVPMAGTDTSSEWRPAPSDTILSSSRYTPSHSQPSEAWSPQQETATLLPPDSSSAALSSAALGAPFEALPTEEMVQILNGRLQGQGWSGSAEEAPPGYSLP
ncbi:hypothetical protein C8J57DRAFT_1251374 [Mycena rebaudengoi]|nr:hypothetical protein C8J57DRAFT_1251374 [Mycena rebaudengoi]